MLCQTRKDWVKQKIKKVFHSITEFSVAQTYITSGLHRLVYYKLFRLIFLGALSRKLEFCGLRPHMRSFFREKRIHFLQLFTTMLFHCLSNNTPSSAANFLMLVFLLNLYHSSGGPQLESIALVHLPFGCAMSY